MAGVDVGGGGGKRSVNQEINMIPFIDLLLVTVAFLLITAVWVSYERMNANAQLPGPNNGDVPPTPVKTLHLDVKDHEFVMTWKQAATVVSETHVPRGDYDALAAKLAEEWKLHSSHADPADRQLDQCVLHTENTVPFKEIIAVMDAIYDAKRDMLVDGQKKKVPAFNMAFASR